MIVNADGYKLDIITITLVMLTHVNSHLNKAMVMVVALVHQLNGTHNLQWPIAKLNAFDQIYEIYQFILNEI